MSIRQAPFTPEEVESLNGFQRWSGMHPFTCGWCPAVLCAGEEGWYCPDCDYGQDWAHSFMADDSWKNGFSYKWLRKYGKPMDQWTKEELDEWNRLWEKQ